MMVRHDVDSMDLELEEAKGLLRSFIREIPRKSKGTQATRLEGVRPADHLPKPTGLGDQLQPLNPVVDPPTT